MFDDMKVTIHVRNNQFFVITIDDLESPEIKALLYPKTDLKKFLDENTRFINNTIEIFTTKPEAINVLSEFITKKSYNADKNVSESYSELLDLNFNSEGDVNTNQRITTVNEETIVNSFHDDNSSINRYLSALKEYDSLNNSIDSYSLTKSSVVNKIFGPADFKKSIVVPFKPITTAEQGTAKAKAVEESDVWAFGPMGWTPIEKNDLREPLVGKEIESVLGDEEFFIGSVVAHNYHYEDNSLLIAELPIEGTSF